MHIICDECFKKAGPIEELTIGSLLPNPAQCEYCGKKSPLKDTHRLRGDTRDLAICRRLGIPAVLSSYFDEINVQRDLTDELKLEIVKDPKGVARQTVEWLRAQNEHGKERIALVIEALLED